MSVALIMHGNRTAQMNSALALKQNALIAGANITISGNTISATGGGSGGLVQSVAAPLQLATTGGNAGQLSINLGAYSTTTQINNALALKQDLLVAGSNIIISGKTISATGSGSGGLVQSVSAPLQLATTGANAGQLSINLGAYSTTTQINSALALKQDSISVANELTL